MEFQPELNQMETVADGSDAWWSLHSGLCIELKLAPWQFPAIERPDAVCTYPPNTAGGMWFPEARRLYGELRWRLLDAHAEGAD